VAVAQPSDWRLMAQWPGQPRGTSCSQPASHGWLRHAACGGRIHGRITLRRPDHRSQPAAAAGCESVSELSHTVQPYLAREFYKMNPF
jgi:hypothetical protein